MTARSRIRRVVDDLSGRSYRTTLDHVVQQLDTCLLGAELARQAAAGALEIDVARVEMRDLEHLGDREKASVVGRLGTALTTPMDREDIVRLSRAIDDVLDNLRDFVRETHLYRIEGDTGVDEIFEAIVDGVAALRTGIDRLRADPQLSSSQAGRARGLSNQVRRLYLHRMAELFGGDLTMDVLTKRELFRRLDLVGQRLADAADALQDGLLKRSH
jgi:uncharacterized protein Yka (UPF0111/DUF47 family)